MSSKKDHLVFRLVFLGLFFLSIRFSKFHVFNKAAFLSRVTKGKAFHIDNPISVINDNTFATEVTCYFGLLGGGSQLRLSFLLH